ncbi:MAG: hypothetical protein C5B57_08135 [Blastocatellia bacterium]|nr:MAG: hypothetical protein C5B57_08135 [Blastocatellia bacterium]
MVAAIAAIALASTRTEAHKPITSPYTYNEDVFSIVHNRCGRCHVAGGVAPMSLMTSKDMIPWGESIRTELVAGHMPPWTVENGPGMFKNGQVLTARELNVLLTWVTGGNPIGNTEHTPQPVTLSKDWPLGPPDLVLPLPNEVTLPVETPDQTQEFTIPTGIAEKRWVRAVDLLPGTPAMVRSASISVKSAAGASLQGGTEAERILSVWVPGENPVPLEGGAAFQLPAAAELLVRVHYKKTWEYERVVMTDRSTVGVYFAPAAEGELRAVSLSPATDAAQADERRVAFTRVLEQDVRALAIYPDRSLTNGDVHVRALRPDGSRVEVIHFRPQPDWARRYWFAQPLALPRGTKIDVSATFNDSGELLPPGAGAPPTSRTDPSAVRLTLNVVAGS